MRKVFVCRKTQISPGKPFVFNISLDEQIVIFQNANGYFAVENRCPHAGALLHEGSVENNLLTCVWHGWQFDLETGQSITEYWAKLKTYPLEISKNKLYVKILGDNKSLK